MKHARPFHILLSAITLGWLVAANAFEFKNGPFDGKAFRVSVPIIWQASNSIPERLPMYRILAEKIPQTTLSNVMAYCSFTSVNLVRSQDTNLIEFRDSRRMEDLTRFLKLSTSYGWINYYDKRAIGTPVRGVPTFLEAENQALAIFVRFGGDTNQLTQRPWPHREATLTSFDKPGGRQTDKVVNMRSVCLFRQLSGVQLVGNYFSVDFGNDARPTMLEMSWPRVQPVERCKVAKQSELLGLLKSGKAFVPAWPEAPDFSAAKSVTVKSITPLYWNGLGADPKELLRPFVSFGLEADIGSRKVNFSVNCPLLSDEKVDQKNHLSHRKKLGSV